VPRDSHLVSSTNKTRCNVNSSSNRPGIEASESDLSIVTEQQEESNVNNSWVGRKVDALFSPVLSFLNGRDNTDSNKANDDRANDSNDETQSNDNFKSSNEKDEEQSVAVSAAIRSALLEASKELQDQADGNDYDNNSNNGLLLHRQHSSEDEFDTVPTMTKTDSTKDADGDLNMAIPNLGLQLSASAESQDNVDNIYNNDTDDESDYRGHALPAASSSQQQQEYNQDEDNSVEEEEFNPFLFIKSLPPYRYAIPPDWIHRPKSLPPPSPSSPSICLVLDLDETLVHCTVEPINNADMVFPVEFNGVEYTVHVRCRPFLKEFLEKVSGEFEVVVFTASQQVYADKLLDMIDPGELGVWCSC
jgi:CTD small phosphatase-like protein 2